MVSNTPETPDANTEKKDSGLRPVFDPAEKAADAQAESEKAIKAAKGEEVDDEPGSKINGTEIIIAAGERISPEVKTLYDFAIGKMRPEEKEDLGDFFYGWQENINGVKKAFTQRLQNKIDGKEEAKEEEKESQATSDGPVAEIQTKAAQSIALTVNRFANDANGKDPSEGKSDASRLWEETRAKAQADFELKAPFKQLDAEEKFFDLLSVKFMMEIEGMKSLAMAEPDEFADLQSELDRKGISLQDEIDALSSENLLREAEDLETRHTLPIIIQFTNAEDGSVMHQPGGLAALAKDGKLKCLLEMKNAEDAQTVYQIIKNHDGLPAFEAPKVTEKKKDDKKDSQEEDKTKEQKEDEKKKGAEDTKTKEADEEIDDTMIKFTTPFSVQQARRLVRILYCSPIGVYQDPRKQ